MVNEEKDKKFQKYGLERYKNLPGDEKQRLLQQRKNCSKKNENKISSQIKLAFCSALSFLWTFKKIVFQASTRNSLFFR